MKNRALLLPSTALAVALLTSTTYAEPYKMSVKQLNADEAAILAKAPPGLKLTKDAIKTLDNKAVEAITINGKNNPDNVKRVERIVDQKKWNYFFPMRKASYTYLNFLKGVGQFPAFCHTYQDERKARSDEICRKSLATMFAHFTQETGYHTPGAQYPQWRQGLFYLREIGWNEQSPNGYGECSPDTWPGKAYPCGKNKDGSYKSYFGRGAKQLSWNYNYGLLSKLIFGDVTVLLNHPEKVADTWLNLASAVFFFVTPQSPKPSMLHVVDGTWQPNAQDREKGRTPGFGVTTQIINGAEECKGTTESQESLDRISYYKSYAKELGVNIPGGEVLGCAGMSPFDESSSAALNVYWDKDWGWSPDTKTHEVYKCELVNYQGPYSALFKGDYRKCVEHNFDVVITG
ncbi:chitinase [Candidatus Sororendozoicomonas aggregata]|uniref:chitinase n=1 Tax=Candidatus Sororendozoicomonas aggregata TaxID=3073239 RepID=UPI002ED13B5A